DLTPERLSLRERDLVVNRHGSHRLEYAVAPNERMDERRRDMQKYQGKEHESKVEVRVPEQRMQAVALRQNRRKVYTSEQHDRVGACRQHPPAEQRHADHQEVERVMRQLGRELH